MRTKHDYAKRKNVFYVCHMHLPPSGVTKYHNLLGEHNTRRRAVKYVLGWRAITYEQYCEVARKERVRYE